MKTLKYTILAGILAIAASLTAAGRNTEKLVFDLHAGINIGGTTPMPFPVEIREIRGFNPLFLPYLEGNVTFWPDAGQWGITSGLRFEYKGMRTVAGVKNYSMEIIGDDGSRMAGVWTGTVATRMKSSYVTIPVLAAFKATDRIHVKAGIFASFLMEGDFGGQVYDGYLRVGDPTGDKINFSDGAVATYDFSNELAPAGYGIQLGADWRFREHLKLYADLSWALSDAFKKSFNTITFSMYPVYARLGVGYSF